MGSGRTLLVLRHAKAAGEPGVNDIKRPLTGGGRRDASAAGRWLLDRGITPDWVLCSPARRARETWERVSAALGAAAPGSDAVNFEARLYEAGAQDVLDLVNEQPNEARTLLTVGHNPASGQLVALLTRRLDIAFPACALAVVRVGESWAAAAPGGGELAELWIPRSSELPGPGTPITGASQVPGRAAAGGGPPEPPPAQNPVPPSRGLGLVGLHLVPGHPEQV
jgi:phosphohistidine phosphatase